MTTKYRSLTRVFVLAALFIFTPWGTPSAHAADYNFYLSTTGTDAGDCDTIVAACATIFYASFRINTITDPGDTATLNVAAGTYISNDTNWTIDFDLTIQGAGTTTTFLDGDDANRALAITLSGASTLEIFAITLQNGNPPSPAIGGGLRLIGTGANLVTLEDVHIRDNTATIGGGVNVNGVNLSLSDVIITNNQTTDGEGGGLGAANSAVTIIGSEISHNLAYRTSTGFNNGGGMSLTNTSLFLTESWIHNNTVEAFAGSGGLGGGIYLFGTTTALDINRTVISNNRIIAPNAGQLALGGGIYCQPSSSTPANFFNTTLSHNSIQDINGLNSANGLAILGGVNCPIFLHHTTVAFNRLEILGPAPTYNTAALSLFGAKTIYNSIVGGTTNANNCSFGDTTTGVSNLSDDSTCAGYTQTANLGIAPLHNVVGWPYPMNPLFLGSAALDFSNSNCLTLDGRGVTRSSPCDIGAFEGFYYPVYLPILRR